jgi:outer membrane protein
MKSALSVLAILAALFCAPVAFAEGEVRIGVIFVDRILRESAPAQTAQKRIDAEVAKRDQELAKFADQINKSEERLEKESLQLPDLERNKRELEIRDMKRDFQRRQREAREDINQRRNKELSAILERTYRIVRQIAETEKIDIILQDVHYANARVDITDKVLRALDDSKQPSQPQPGGK